MWYAKMTTGAWKKSASFFKYVQHVDDFLSASVCGCPSSGFFNGLAINHIHQNCFNELQVNYVYLKHSIA